jgi:hypothetical protein
MAPYVHHSISCIIHPYGTSFPWHIRTFQAGFCCYGPLLQERCQCALVCSHWRCIINSAAAHARDQSDIPLSDTRTLPCDVYATEEQQQLKLQQCRAVRHAPSAALTLNQFAPTTMQQLTSLTRLVLIDPDVLRQQLDGEAFVQTPQKAAVPVGLHQLSKLRVLSVAMSSPLLDVAELPHSLAALHLDFSSGVGGEQLLSKCARGTR